MDELTLFVPRTEAVKFAPRSAIVGTMTDDEEQLLDYEGNIYGSSQLVSYETRAEHAADRHVKKYPTVARTRVRREFLHVVGKLRYLTGFGWYVSEIVDSVALASWLGDERLPAIGGSAAFRERVASKAMHRLSFAEVARLTTRAKASSENLADVIFAHVLAAESPSG